MNVLKNSFGHFPTSSFVRSIMTKTTEGTDAIVNKLAKIVIAGLPSSQSIPYLLLFEQSVSHLNLTLEDKRNLWNKTSEEKISRFQKFMSDVYIDRVLKHFDKDEILVLYAAYKKIRNEKLALATLASKLTIKKCEEELTDEIVEEGRLLDEKIFEMLTKFKYFFDTEEKAKIYKKLVIIENNELNEIRNRAITLSIADQIIPLHKE